jgi:hypothetical protein
MSPLDSGSGAHAPSRNDDIEQVARISEAKSGAASTHQTEPGFRSLRSLIRATNIRRQNLSCGDRYANAVAIFRAVHIGNLALHGLTQQAADFLKSVGLNPTAADVVAADKEGEIHTTYNGDPVSYSLESLATAKKARAVRVFVATRKAIRELKANPTGFKIPGGLRDYDGIYLTPSELPLMFKKITAPR